MSCSLVHRSNIPIFPVLQSIWRNSCCTETHRTRSPVWWPAACLAGCRFGSLPPRFFFPCISRTCRPWKLQQQASHLRSFCIQITSPPSAHASPCVFTGWSDEAAHSSLFYPEKFVAVGCVWLIIRRLKDEKVLLTETLKALKKARYTGYHGHRTTCDDSRFAITWKRPLYQENVYVRYSSVRNPWHGERVRLWEVCRDCWSEGRSLLRW